MKTRPNERGGKAQTKPPVSFLSRAHDIITGRGPLARACTSITLAHHASDRIATSVARRARGCAAAIAAAPLSESGSSANRSPAACAGWLEARAVD